MLLVRMLLTAKCLNYSKTASSVMKRQEYVGCSAVMATRLARVTFKLIFRAEFFYPLLGDWRHPYIHLLPAS